MRLLLITLLVSCLFFLKGYCSGTPGKHRHYNKVCATVKNDDRKKIFFEQQSSDNTLFFLTADDGEDDDDEDEFQSPENKKKGFQFDNNKGGTADNIAPLFYLKNTNRFYKNFSYPSSDEYIFHRTIMI